ncbi:MAG: Ada metal-binding domain-containing protein [Rubrivivax sp.]|jgi:AraC family transcriptional regulator of adaptative response / DNA-3-methyladenine glycosylase II
MHTDIHTALADPAPAPGLLWPDGEAPSAQWYAALLARDARFDGRFFVGVTSTGIYCRPVCRVRAPLLRNCRFFGHAAGAEASGFRPCLRCRPELAPGLSLIDSPAALAHDAARQLDAAAALGHSLSMPALALRLGVTDRHLRRIFGATYGVAPLDYLTTRRLLRAKQLLTDTDWPVTQVALACGFASLRRFHAAFAERYRLNPSQLRQHRTGEPAGDASPLTLRLSWRPPYDIAGMRRFWAVRALPGIEHTEGEVDQLVLTRSWRLPHEGAPLTGWTQVRFDAARCQVELRVSAGLLPALGLVIQRHRDALDLDADPARVDPVIERLGLPPCPGLRLPGALDGWETAVRIILGQQVSVAAARTLASRLVEHFGEAFSAEDAPPQARLARVFPDAARIAQASPESIGRLGIVRQRVGALQALASAVCDGSVVLEPTAPLLPTLERLRALPGIGEWTAQLVALRVLHWPDAFPTTDIGLLNAMGTRDVRAVDRAADAWRPWRAYAVIRWWQTLEKTDA